MIKFGTDGWRAVIAEDFTFENVKIVAQAVADYLKNIKRGQSKVVIGYDCRFLSGEFAQTVALVLAAGAEVVSSWLLRKTVINPLQQCLIRQN